MHTGPRYVLTVRWYARPEGDPHQLRVAPRLASWDRAGDLSQVRLRAYLDDTQALLASARVEGPWALRLDVGLPTGHNLLRESDADNYLQPLAEHLYDRDLRSVWCTKQHGEKSFVRIEAPREVPPPSTSTLVASSPSASNATAYKERILAAVAGEPALPAGAVRLGLSFVVGPGRNWLNLWKMTIDSLEPLLGRDPAETRPWHPDDGRITELSMHLTVDPAIGHEVVVGIAAAPL
jgi:hypothetical protein